MSGRQLLQKPLEELSADRARHCRSHTDFRGRVSE